jgi:Response regulator containing CheY-like receiver, AAA-type ATPase, and DNA-binding domains
MVCILIIDDSAFQRKIISSVLNGENHTVITATNGHEGLKKAVLEKPDLIITDLLMPEMDGGTFLSEVKKAGLSIPVIILTSDVQKVTRDRCLALGAFSVLNKPVNREALLELIRTALSGRVP